MGRILSGRLCCLHWDFSSTSGISMNAVTRMRTCWVQAMIRAVVWSQVPLVDSPSVACLEERSEEVVMTVSPSIHDRLLLVSFFPYHLHLQSILVSCRRSTLSTSVSRRRQSVPTCAILYVFLLRSPERCASFERF